MATLETLAPELLILIQRMVESPRDLHSLIKASPTCLHTFCLNRARILSSVVVNGIQPGALRHAIAISYAPAPEAARSHQRKRRRRNPGIAPNPLEPFLDKYFSAEPFDLPTEISDLAALCRLQTLVSRFANEYFERATRLLRAARASTPQSHCLPCRDDVTPLSRSELTRLQRAFFRHELYCRITPSNRDAYCSRTFPTSPDQFRLFIARLEPWEAEEMSCVHDYLTYISRRAVEDLEGRVVQAVLASPGVERPCKSRLSPPESQRTRFRNPFEARLARRRELDKNASTDPPIDPPSLTYTAPTTNGSRGGGEAPTDHGKKMVAFDDLESWGLRIFEMNSQRDTAHDVSNLAALGLEAMSRLADGDAELRRIMIQEHISYARPFLGEALGQSPARDHTPTRIRVEGPGSDNPSQANVGYRLFRPDDGRVYGQIYDHFHVPMYSPLRERGYVFWDAARIDDGVSRRSLVQARDVSDETADSMSWMARTSVEERLQGVRMPLSVKERITREFGCPGWFDAEDEDDE